MASITPDAVMQSLMAMVRARLYVPAGRMKALNGMSESCNVFHGVLSGQELLQALSFDEDGVTCNILLLQELRHILRGCAEQKQSLNQHVDFRLTQQVDACDDELILDVDARQLQVRHSSLDQLIKQLRSNWKQCTIARHYQYQSVQNLFARVTDVQLRVLHDYVTTAYPQEARTAMEQVTVIAGDDAKGIAAKIPRKTNRGSHVGSFTDAFQKVRQQNSSVGK